MEITENDLLQIRAKAEQIRAVNDELTTARRELERLNNKKWNIQSEINEIATGEKNQYFSWSGVEQTIGRAFLNGSTLGLDE